ELVAKRRITDILAKSEAARLVAEMKKLSGVEAPSPSVPDSVFSEYLECVRTLPPSMVPSFEAQLLRKDGSVVPTALHISALRDNNGTLSGLVAVAVDQSATHRQDQALRESQERYRDLFENSSEMIATLSPTGRFLYANPAWKRGFGYDDAGLLALESFEEL